MANENNWWHGLAKGPGVPGATDFAHFDQSGSVTLSQENLTVDSLDIGSGATVQFNLRRRA